MKRDMELVRRILLEVESWPLEGGDQTFTALGCQEKEVEYNVYQAIRSGLLDGIIDDTERATEGFFYNVFGLTPEGHDFLDAAQDQFIWDEVMGEVRKRGVKNTSFDILKRLLDKAVRRKLGVDE
jgi:hypothetical protein